MTLIVVIPVLNEAAHLPRLLEQFVADPVVDRIVVADGGSTDGSREIVTAWAAHDTRIVLLANPDRIQSAGINRAVAIHGGAHRWLLRVDAHCRYPDGYARRLLAAAETKNATSVVVPLVTTGSGCFQRAAAAAQNSAIGTGGSAHRHLGQGRFVDHGHHALMNLALFRQVGGYCAAMHCNEDAELDHRLVAAGGRIWLEPGAAVGYFPRSTPKGLWRQYRRYGEGRARNIARHRMRLKPRQAIPLLVPIALALLPLAFLSPLLALPALFWATAVGGAGIAVGLRTGGGCALFSGIAAMIMHAAWGFGYIKERLTHPGGVPARHGLGKLGRETS
ncbi:glycosyltransferase family 2 protein [Sphingomonas panaciterrae]|uniref:glycosyltransferase family 2 protein n=1 Tax=Sphingomonas panaciterrae TaxID=1462999 RepID=UPI002FF375AB